MNRFAKIGQRLFNAPLMLRPEKIEVLVAALADRMGIMKLHDINGTSLGVVELKQMADAALDEPRREESGYYQVDDIAIIKVDGTLVHKLGGVDPWSGMVGFDQIKLMVARARAAKDVNAILVDQDSGGGEVSGCFDTAKYIYEGSARFGGKPIYAFANEMSCSASYALSAACDRIATPETGIVGSIGVWLALTDLTKALDDNGIKVTIIRAGERKARGGPYEVADDATIEKFQALADETRSIFANHIAKFRNVPIKGVLQQEGDWYTSGDALDRNLVDGIASEDQLMAIVAEAAAQYRRSQ